MATVDLALLSNKTYGTGTGTDITGAEQIIINDSGTAADVTINVVRDKIRTDTINQLILPGGAAGIGVVAADYTAATNVAAALLEIKDIAESANTSLASDLALPAGAAMVGFNANGTIASTTVQAAIDELNTDLRSLVGGLTATDIDFTPNGGAEIAATNTQDAIVEVRNDLVAKYAANSGSSLIGYLPDSGPSVSVQTQLRTDTTRLNALTSAVNSAVKMWTPGIYDNGQVVASSVNQFIYMKIGGTTTTSSDPSVDSVNWQLIGNPGYTAVVLSVANHNAAKNTHVIMTNAGKCICTLPTGEEGNMVYVTFTNNRYDNEIKRTSGNTIMGISDDTLVIDLLQQTVKLRYVSGSWRLI